MSDTAAPTNATSVAPQSSSNPNPAAQGISSANPSQGQDNTKKATDEVLKSLNSQSQETDDIEDDGSDLPEEAQTKQQKEAAKKYKLKVSGKDVEVDEAELLKRAQMGFSADEKWQEAAKLRKQLENFVNFMQKDPEAALTKMGFNVEELAAGVIEKRIEQMKKSPEQLELERLRQEREELIAEREREKQTHHERELKRMQDEYAVTIENDINSALESPDFGLPKSPYFVKRIADVLMWGIQNKKEISASKAAEIVRDEYLREQQEYYNQTPDEALERIIGKDRLNKYRRSKVKKSATKPAPGVADVKPTGTSELRAMYDEKPKEKVKMRDFFKGLGNK
jgi:hypothetical protein